MFPDTIQGSWNPEVLTRQQKERNQKLHLHQKTSQNNNIYLQAIPNFLASFLMW